MFGDYHIFYFVNRNNVLYEGYASVSMIVKRRPRTACHIKVSITESNITDQAEAFVITLNGFLDGSEIKEDILIEKDGEYISSNIYDSLNSIVIEDFGSLKSVPYIVISSVNTDGDPAYHIENELCYGRYGFVRSTQTVVDFFNRGQEFRDIIRCVLDGKILVEKGQSFKIIGQDDEYVVLTSPKYRTRLGSDSIEFTEFYAGVNYTEEA